MNASVSGRAAAGEAPSAAFFRRHFHIRLLLLVPLVCLAFALTLLPAGAGYLEDARQAHGAANLDDAIRLYQYAVDQGDWATARDGRFGIASCLLAKGEHDAAVEAFLDFARRYPGDTGAVLAYVHAGNSRMEQGQVDAAEALYKRAEQQAAYGASDAVWKSWVELGKGRVHTARKEYEEAVPFLLKAVRLASEARVTEIARECLQECAKALDSTGRGEEAEAWLGESLLTEGQWEADRLEWARASDALRAALPYLKSDEDTGRANALLAVALSRSRDWDDAVAHAQEAIKLLPEDMEANPKTAELLLEAYRVLVRGTYRLQRYDEALAAAKVVEPLARGRNQGVLIDCLYLESLALQAKKQFLEAAVPLRKILELDDKLEWKVTPHFYLPRLLADGGDLEGAKAAYREAIESPGMDHDVVISSKMGLARLHIQQGERIPAVLLWMEVAEDPKAKSWANSARDYLRTWSGDK